MPHRIINAFLNNPKVIESLSQSLPIKTLARFIVRQGKAAEQKLDEMNLGQKADRFKNLLEEEYKKALKK
ncbi:hypothetical protein WR25_18977 [Diploscapter pachys]|uniref:Uncharacterized protein n=1 Tax=Diploscapter pachys TaxID=2018661 RepID=A0A2A2M0R0_9BILA|nr:hypothetical protein WR25_18977 [Diploscapter pachys]